MRVVPWDFNYFCTSGTLVAVLSSVGECCEYILHVYWRETCRLQIILNSIHTIWTIGRIGNPGRAIYTLYIHFRCVFLLDCCYCFNRRRLFSFYKYKLVVVHTEMKSLLVLVCFAAIAVAQLEKCGLCKSSECRKPFGCVAGKIKDRCGCCDICGNREGMRCDVGDLSKYDPSKYKYGSCGKNLLCKVHPDSQPDIIETVCFCKYSELVCGSNGKTYDNACQMMADGYRLGKKISVFRTGPCTSAPWIETPPDDILNSTGGDITLSCEVMGNPIPYIEWRKNGQPIVLPGDDRHIAVQSRGGPEKHELTGWLQIQGLRKTDEGQYTCIARNGQGVAQATAAISIGANFVDSSVDEEESESTIIVDYDTDFDNEVEDKEESSETIFSEEDETFDGSGSGDSGIFA